MRTLIFQASNRSFQKSEAKKEVRGQVLERGQRLKRGQRSEAKKRSEVRGQRSGVRQRSKHAELFEQLLNKLDT